jgi:general stress protein 26
MTDMTENEVARRVQALVRRVTEGDGEAVLTTVRPDGSPHATWMGTLSARGGRELVTITSPDSEKVINIRENPQVEWMFTDEEKTVVVYFRGEAVLVKGMDRIKAAWEAIHDKGRAFFLEHYNSGIGFAVIRTTVQSVEYCVPEEFRKEAVPLESIHGESTEVE